PNLRWVEQQVERGPTVRRKRTATQKSSRVQKAPRHIGSGHVSSSAPSVTETHDTTPSVAPTMSIPPTWPAPLIVSAKVPVLKFLLPNASSTVTKDINLTHFREQCPALFEFVHQAAIDIIDVLLTRDLLALHRSPLKTEQLIERQFTGVV